MGFGVGFDSRVGLWSGLEWASILTGVDLLFAILPERAFTNPEIGAMRDFLMGNTSIFFITEYSDYPLLGSSNVYINAALTGLGSGMSLVPSTYDISWWVASSSQIASDPVTLNVTSLTYAAYTEVSGGKVLTSHYSFRNESCL